MFAPDSTGGTEILEYDLQMDKGGINTIFDSITSYDKQSLEKIVYPTDGLSTVGNIYTFKFRAKNILGYSEFSDVLRVGFGNKILPPSSISADLVHTGPNYITIKWTQVASGDLPT